MRQINLLPEALKKGHSEKPIFTSVGITLLALALVITGVVWIVDGKLKSIKLELAGLEEKQDAPSQQTISGKAKTQELIKERNDIIESNSYFAAILDKRTDARRVLNILARLSEGDIWLEEIELDTNQRIIDIKGLANNTTSVSEFLFDFKKIPLFSTGELSSMDEVTSGKTKKIRFGINGRIKK